MDNTLTECAAVDETVVFLNYSNLRGHDRGQYCADRPGQGQSADTEPASDWKHRNCGGGGRVCVDLGQGLKQTSFKAQDIIISSDSIYKVVAGECSGTVLQTPDGKTQGMGYCARRDKDGDTQSISWHQAPGADKGKWKSTSGKGKYAGKQDSGWSQIVLADGKITVDKWGGDCH
jgi:hypothetical protein